MGNTTRFKVEFDDGDDREVPLGKGMKTIWRYPGETKSRGGEKNTYKCNESLRRSSWACLPSTSCTHGTSRRHCISVSLSLTQTP